MWKYKDYPRIAILFALRKTRVTKITIKILYIKIYLFKQISVRKHIYFNSYKAQKTFESRTVHNKPKLAVTLHATEQ